MEIATPNVVVFQLDLSIQQGNNLNKPKIISITTTTIPHTRCWNISKVLSVQYARHPRALWYHPLLRLLVIIQSSNSNTIISKSSNLAQRKNPNIVSHNLNQIACLSLKKTKRYLFRVEKSELLILNSVFSLSQKLIS